MNQKFYIKISRMARNNGWEITEIPYGVKITTMNSIEYDLMIRSLRRMKNIYFESYRFTNTVRVYDRNDYAAYTQSAKRFTMILDYFWMELRRNGGDQEAAKESQRAYAESIGGLAEYNKIYA